jgi:hypothetical protein
MKCEIGRRRHRRAVKVLGRLVFTTLGPLTLGLLFAAYSPPAHADTITVFGTPGTPGVDGTATTPPTNGGPGGDANATTPPNSDPSNTANATGGAGGTGGASASTGFPVGTEELAAMPRRPPPRAQPTAVVMASLPQGLQGAQGAQPALPPLFPRAQAGQAALRRRTQS